MTKLSPVLTDVMMVKWSNLLKPDIAFGENSANHNITIVVTPELQTVLDDILKSSKAKKVNGIRKLEDGTVTLKVKSKMALDKGHYPCVDSNSEPTEVVPFGGDKVRLKLQPCVVARDNSLSLYLNGVQIVAKEARTSSSTFTKIENGFINPMAPAVTIPEVSDNECPF